MQIDHSTEFVWLLHFQLDNDVEILFAFIWQNLSIKSNSNAIDWTLTHNNRMLRAILVSSNKLQLLFLQKLRKWHASMHYSV